MVSQRIWFHILTQLQPPSLSFHPPTTHSSDTAAGVSDTHPCRYLWMKVSGRGMVEWGPPPPEPPDWEICFIRPTNFFFRDGPELFRLLILVFYSFISRTRLVVQFLGIWCVCMAQSHWTRAIDKVYSSTRGINSTVLIILWCCPSVFPTQYVIQQNITLILFIVHLQTFALFLIHIYEIAQLYRDLAWLQNIDNGTQGPNVSFVRQRSTLVTQVYPFSFLNFLPNLTSSGSSFPGIQYTSYFMQSHNSLQPGSIM